MPPLRPPGRGPAGGRFVAFLIAVALLASVGPAGTAAEFVDPDDVVGTDRPGEVAVGSQASIGLGSGPAVDPFDQLDSDDEEAEDDEEGEDGGDEGEEGDEEEGDGGDDADDLDEDDQDENDRDDGDDDGDGGDDERGDAEADDGSDAAGPPFGEGRPDESGVGDFVETVLTEIAGGPDDDGPEDGDEEPSGSDEADGSGADDGAGDAAGDVDAAESESVESGGDEARGPPAPAGDGSDGEPASQVEEPTPTQSPTPARIRVDDVSTNRSVVAEGEPVSITATLVNTGETGAEHQVRLRLFGEVVDARTVTVPANGDREVSFVRTILAPGTYEATVGNASATVTVEPRRSTTPTDAEPASQETPGFTVLAALLGVVVAALLLRFRSG